MQPNSPFASNSMTAPAGVSGRSRQTDERVYQAFTVAAILLVLGSLWLF